MDRHFLLNSLAAAVAAGLLSTACATAPAKPDEALSSPADGGAPSAADAPKTSEESAGNAAPEASGAAQETPDGQKAQEAEKSPETPEAASESSSPEGGGAETTLETVSEQPAESPQNSGPKPLPPEVVTAFDEALRLAADPSGNGLQEAMDKLAPLATDDPRTAAVHYNLGLLQERAGDLTKAEKHYASCLGLDPAHRSAALNLARLFIRQRRADEGIRFFEKRLSSAAPTPALHDALAFLFAQTDRHKESIAAARAALKLDEMDTEAMGTLAGVYAAQKRFELAQLVLGNALAIAPDDPVLANQQGLLMIAQGKNQEARAFFQKAAEGRRDYPEAHNNFGASLLSAQNFPEAVEHLELALRYAPDFSEARINLASAYRGMGDFAKARELYLQALKDSPEMAADIEFNLGLLFLDARDTGLDLTEQLNEAKEHLSASEKLRHDENIAVYLKDADKALAKEKRRLEREERKRQKELKERQKAEAEAEARRAEEAKKAQEEQELQPSGEASVPEAAPEGTGENQTPSEAAGPRPEDVSEAAPAQEEAPEAQGEQDGAAPEPKVPAPSGGDQP